MRTTLALTLLAALATAFGMLGLAVAQAPDPDAADPVFNGAAADPFAATQDPFANDTAQAEAFTAAADDTASKATDSVTQTSAAPGSGEDASPPPPPPASEPRHIPGAELGLGLVALGVLAVALRRRRGRA